MEAKYLAAVCLFTACVSYVPSKTYYIQLSTNPPGSCAEWNCYAIDDGLVQCDRRWILNGQLQNDTTYLKRIGTTDKHDIVQRNGVSIGRIREEEKENGVLKVTIRGNDKEGNIIKIVCNTDERQPTSDDEKTMATFCNVEGMQKVDNTNCI